MSDTPDSNDQPEEDQQVEIEQQHLNAGLAEQFAEGQGANRGADDEPDQDG